MGLFRSKAESFFTRSQGKQIVRAIKAAEKETSGEIRVHLEAHIRKDIVERASEVFSELNMHETAKRNGVLIYLATEDHRFVIFADEGINQVVPEGFWEGIAENMTTHFKKQAFVEGLTEGISRIGAQLQSYFPFDKTDENELPDEISYG